MSTYNLDELLALQIDREVKQKELGIDRFRRQLEKRKAGKDYSRSAAGKVLTNTLLSSLVGVVEEAFENTLRGAGIQSGLIGEIYSSLKAVSLIDLATGQPTGDTFSPWCHEQAALIAFRVMLDTVQMPLYTIEEEHRGRRYGARPNLYTLHQEIGTRLQMQIILNYGRAYFPDNERRNGFITRLLREAYSDQASANHKDTVTRIKLSDLADWYEQQDRGPLAEIFRWTPWSNRTSRIFGAKLVSLIQGACEITEGYKVFTLTAGDGGNQFLSLTPGGQILADGIDDQAGQKAFWDLPMLCPPVPHTPNRKGGYLGIEEARKGLPACGMYKGFLSTSEAHLQFLNRQAGVPLRINRKILEVMEGINALTGDARNVGKFIPLPIRDHFVAEMQEHLKDRPSSDLEKRRMRDALKVQNKAFFQREATAKSIRIGDLLMVAKFCKDDPQIFIPTRGDFRGRTYATAPLLSYQGIDPSKALLEFAEPVGADEKTQFWMEMDLSSNMGFDKASTAERQAFVQSQLELIVASVRDPINHDFWKNQEKPWLFLAVAQEYVRLFVDHDPDRLTRCRVSVDATCSGQQLMAGLTQSLATAQQVNLVSQDRPTDVYGNVIAVAAKAIQAHQDGVVQFFPRGKQHPAEGIKPSKLRELISSDRAARKRARAGGKAIVMVAQYGAGKTRRITEFAEKCQLQSGTFTEPEVAALYPFFKAGLDACLECLDPFLQWCQGVAKAALVNPDGSPKLDPETGLPKTVILLPSADGSITTQSYRLMESQGRITTDHLGSFTNKQKRRFEKDQMPTSKPDLSKHISSTAANLIHAQDGAVLALALGDLDLPFTTCHDSIAGRPSREMDQIVDRLLTALFEVFTSDVLQRFVELNGLDWKDHPAPDFGTYDPSLVLKASLAFS